MARRRTKKRTHVGASNGAKNTPAASSASSKSPKSMVIRIGAGEVGPSVSQLVKDVRSMMEPDTASRLRERKSNKLRDYVTMAGPLGVSHLLLFSRSTSGNTNLRLALTPRGPTLHFRVEKYSLCKDVRKALRHPKGGGSEFASAPLLVMNNFQTPASTKDTSEIDPDTKKVPRHLEQLTTTIFQSLFPPISPTNTPLTSIRRVLLANREPTSDGTYILNLRHYAITTKRAGLSRPLRRLNAAEKLLNDARREKGLPKLGRLDDVADYMIGGENGEGAYMTDATSGSEADTDAEVEILESTTRRVLDKKARQKARAHGDGVNGTSGGPATEKRAVKLVELGPRMRLRMTKVEDGVCDGKVMWHEYISKTKAEVAELDQRWAVRNKEKAERKRIQKENVERKKAEAPAKRKRQGPHAEKQDGAEENEDDDDDDDELIKEWDSEGLEGDGETAAHDAMDEKGEWSEEEDDMAEAS